MGINDKIALGSLLSRKYTDPGSMLNLILTGSVLASAASAAICLTYEDGKYKYAAPLPLLGVLATFEASQHFTAPAPRQAEFITFIDPAVEKRWKGRKIPGALLTTLYLDGSIDFKIDVLQAFEEMDEFMSYRLHWSSIKFLLTQLSPWTSASNSTHKDKKTTKKEIEEHYNRGNDFFNAFLGPRMIYTSAIFMSNEDTLESAQDNKLHRICTNLNLKPGQRLLDIGCGWGTLAGYAHKNYKVHATGVTLSQEGANWSAEHNPQNEKVEGEEVGSIDFQVMDYRDIPTTSLYDAISCVEMAEHVGLENFQPYLHKVHSNLKDEGNFYIQVAGFRKGSDWKDMNWALFMSQYIFPGADASCPLNWYIGELEQGGFEVEKIENIGIHYSLTLNEWYNNWCSTVLPEGSPISKKYAPSILRLWRLFLAWATMGARRGSATCWMITCHKTVDEYDRSKMIKTAPDWAEKAKFWKFK